MRKIYDGLLRSGIAVLTIPDDLRARFFVTGHSPTEYVALPLDANEHYLESDLGKISMAVTFGEPTFRDQNSDPARS